MRSVCWETKSITPISRTPIMLVSEVLVAISQSYPVGGFGHQRVQIKQFVDWGLDFIKVDKCRLSSGWTEESVESDVCQVERFAREVQVEGHRAEHQCVPIPRLVPEGLPDGSHHRGHEKNQQGQLARLRWCKGLWSTLARKTTNPPLRRQGFLERSGRVGHGRTGPHSGQQKAHLALGA